MENIVISTISNNYFDVFNTDIFTGKRENKQNWLEMENQYKENLFQVKQKESNDTE